MFCDFSLYDISFLLISYVIYTWYDLDADIDISFVIAEGIAEWLNFIHQALSNIVIAIQIQGPILD